MVVTKNILWLCLISLFKLFYDVQGITDSGVPHCWLLTINITEYDDDLKKFYKENGVDLTDRPEAAADPTLLESALNDGLLPRDKFKRIYSPTNLNGSVTRRDYIKAINEIHFQWDFNKCKLLFIYIGGHGVAGDQILFSDGGTVHYTDIIDQFRNRYTMMNKPIICLNNFC